MSRRFLLLLLPAVVTGLLARPALSAIDLPTDFVAQTIVSGLDQPLGMAFLPDGRLLVTEQHTGKLRMVVNGHIAATDPVLTVPNFNGTGYERGFQCVAVDPGWPARPYVYLFYNRTGGYIRLVRYTASGALTDPNGESLTLSTPLLLLDNLVDTYHNHNGGTLRFGPDGHLYASLGEDGDGCAAADSTRLKGAILRLDVSRLPTGGGGPVPKALLVPSNPSLATTDSSAMLVFAYGVRNPWRFQIDSATGLLYAGDVGEGTYEELTEVASGDNLGWPFREGTQVRLQGGCSEPGGSGRGKYKAPIVTLNHSIGVAAILAIGAYRPGPTAAARFPGYYHGDVFYADYFTGFIRRLKKVNGSWMTPAPVAGQPNASDWATGFTSPVDAALAPDGSLWVLSQWNEAQSTNSGSVQRVTFVGSLADAPSGASAGRGLRASPNPFASGVELSFANAAAGPVTLTVFDVNGRRVKELWNAWTEAGDRKLSWDGRDDAGTLTAPGVYLVRMTRRTDVETLRVLRVH